MQPGQLLGELTLQTKLTHSEVLLPHVRQVLAMTKVDKRLLGAIAVSIGPGSFTGLRIGLATAKALSYALGIPLVGVPTLAALASHYPVPGICVAPLLDAQKNNVYAGWYAWEGGAVQELAAPEVLAFEEAVRKGADWGRPVVFVGEMAARRASEIAALAPKALPAPAHVIMPRAACVAALGLQLLAAGKTDDVMALEPLYIRRSEAEVLWERRCAGR